MPTGTVPRPPLDRRAAARPRRGGVAPDRRPRVPGRHRPSRRRVVAAGALVAALAVACVAVARDRGAGPPPDPAPRGGGEAGAAPSRPLAPPSTAGVATGRAAREAAALRALAGAPGTCRTRVEEGGVRLTCPIEHGTVELARPADPAREYRRALGPDDGTRATGPPACAAGRPEERAWSRPDAPAVTAGRYACRVVAGRAEIWWTEDATALLAHATRADGDLAALYEWWRAGAPLR
ncbi:MAG: hypothetical protein KatS3mg009_2651 [Acidimicrobiia bacterium]|nr:MAG: hypothetical protein KatS3mg009_2651 [Acidimicrobiia bacterium]